MLRENEERWKQLCQQASIEQDPEKLREPIKEINDLLAGKYNCVKSTTPPTEPATDCQPTSP
jgi:hypothetical protein